MIIFLYGPDGYRLKENTDTIVGAYRKKHKSGMSYYSLDFTSPTCKGIEEVSNAIKSVSFFDEVKLIIVRNPFLVGNIILDKLALLIDDFKVAADKKTVLVFIENRTEKELQKTGKALFVFLTAKPNLVRDINYLEGAKLSDWVRGKFKENGHNVYPAVSDLLVERVGNESWALANEVKKLSNYLTGKTCQVLPVRSCLLTKEDVDLLVDRKESNSIFDLVDAVGNQNKARAFEMMYCLINSGHDGHYLLSMLVYHFENLLSVSDMIERNDRSLSPELIAKKCGLHPFVAKKALSQVRKFQKGNLVAKFNRLAGLDVASKSGLVNLEDSLYNFVVS